MAVRVAFFHGRVTPTRSGTFQYYLDHLSAYKAAQHGHDVYKHVGTVAIISEGTVVTAYHAEEESVHPRL